MTALEASKLQPGQKVRSVKFGDVLEVVAVDTTTRATRFGKTRLQVWLVVCRVPGYNFVQTPKDIDQVPAV